MLIARLGSLVPRHGQFAIAIYMRHEGNTGLFAIMIKTRTLACVADEKGESCYMYCYGLFGCTIGSFEGRTLTRLHHA